MSARSTRRCASASDCEALWNGIADGTIDTVATDHIHRDLSSKDGGIWKASPGCPGIDTLLPVLLSEGHHKRKLSLGRIARPRGGGAGQCYGPVAPQGPHRGRARRRFRYRRRAGGTYSAPRQSEIQRSAIRSTRACRCAGACAIRWSADVSCCATMSLSPMQSGPVGSSRAKPGEGAA